MKNIDEFFLKTLTSTGMKARISRGWRENHEGIDYSGIGQEGHPVCTPVAGEVKWAHFGRPGTGNGFGNHIGIEDNAGFVHVFAHLKDMDVRQFQRVAAGDHIGTLGNTGQSTGPHLHYHIQQGGYYKGGASALGVGNPLAYNYDTVRWIITDKEGDGPMKIIVCWAGHGGRDPGAVANGLNEKDLNLAIALELEKQMQSYECNFILGRRTDVFVNLGEKAKFCDAQKSDLNIDIHCNAGGGTGFESFIWNGLSMSSKTAGIAAKIHSHLADLFKNYGSRDRGLKQGKFFILQNTRAPAWLPEYGFLDDRTGIDPDNLRNPGFIEDIAIATAKGIAEAMGLQKKTTAPSLPSEPEPTGEVWFRVVAGSYKDRSNAEEQIERLKKQGHNAFLSIYRP